MLNCICLSGCVGCVCNLFVFSSGCYVCLYGLFFVMLCVVVNMMYVLFVECVNIDM